MVAVATRREGLNFLAIESMTNNENQPSREQCPGWKDKASVDEVVKNIGEIHKGNKRNFVVTLTPSLDTRDGGKSLSEPGWVISLRGHEDGTLNTHDLGKIYRIGEDGNSTTREQILDRIYKLLAAPPSPNLTS
jgi:hypothetical protein